MPARFRANSNDWGGKLCLSIELYCRKLNVVRKPFTMACTIKLRKLSPEAGVAVFAAELFQYYMCFPGLEGVGCNSLRILILANL